MGGVGEVGQLEPGYTFHYDIGRSNAVFYKWQKQTHSTGYAKTVVGSLIPHISLLVPLTGSTGPVVHLCGLTESADSCL